MLTGVKTILFTSDLSENSRFAFNHAAVMATRFNAKIVLLHVVEKRPESIESRVVSLFGQEKWNGILESHMADAQRLLMGKVTPQHIVRAALGEFCRDAGIEDGACGYVEREIIVKEGDVVEEILGESRAHGCDVIVMGAHKGFLSGTTIGTHIKAVLKKSNIPVLVVPPFSHE